MERIVRTWTRLREPWFSGRELPVPDFGLSCLRCGADLVGAKRQACPACGEPFDLAARQPRDAWFLVDESVARDVPLPALESLLASEYVPYFRERGKLLREIYMGPSVLAARLRVPREFYFDVLYLVRRASLEMQRVRHARHAPGWRCRRCGESVPAHFEVCWNCQSPRFDAFGTMPGG